MISGAWNLQIYQNATFTEVFTWLAGACSCTAGGIPYGQISTPVDLTGYTALMQFRQFAPAGTLLYDASVNITLGGIAGTITVTIPNTVTSSFTWTNAVYDLLLTSSSGVATALLSGTVTVTPGVST